VDESSTSERAGASALNSDWETIADRTPPVSRARPALSAALPERTVQRGPWPAGASLEPPPALWARIEAQLRIDGIISEGIEGID